MYVYKMRTQCKIMDSFNKITLSYGIENCMSARMHDFAMRSRFVYIHS